MGRVVIHFLWHTGRVVLHFLWISSELLQLLYPNLASWCLIMRARVMWKTYFSGHGQGHPTPQKQQQRNKKTQLQDTTVWTSISSEVLSFLLWNIVWQFIIVSFSLLWKKKATTTKKDCCVQGHSTGQWMFVRKTFSELLDPFCNQTQCGDVPHHYKPKRRVCMSQWGLMYQSMMFSTIFCEVMIRLRTLIYEPLQWPWWPRP